VTNQATPSTYSSLQDAVNAAAGGAHLLVTGTCTGTTTISTNLTITGRLGFFHRAATLYGGGQGSVVIIDLATTVTLDSLVITGGNAPGTSAFDGTGGGIRNFGTVTLNNSVVSGNTAFGGGGIANDSGTVTLNNSIVSGNTATFGGGGIYNGQNSLPGSVGCLYGAVTLNGSTSVRGNTTAGDGGGIFNCGDTVTLNGTATVSGNTASADGGGIWNGGTVTFTFRATVSGNTARITGGGIRNFGTLNSAYAGINVFGNKPDNIA
jgi:hypothetical protein